jgi:hypothetical protein
LHRQTKPLLDFPVYLLKLTDNKARVVHR